MNILQSPAAHSSAPTRQIQNDPIALAIVLVIIAIFAIMVLRKSLLSRKQTAQVQSAAKVKKDTARPTAPGSAGEVKLYNVEPKTAAMLMAIVADKMGKPINELRFISVREVE